MDATMQCGGNDHDDNHRNDANLNNSDDVPGVHRRVRLVLDRWLVG